MKSFTDGNNVINIRVLVYYFNNLFKKQYNLYRNSNIHLLRKKLEENNNTKSFNIFTQDVLLSTYFDARQDELTNINKLLKSQIHEILFKEINVKSYKNGQFKLGDLNIVKLNIERTELESLLEHLKLLGFCKEREKHSYLLPRLYQQQIDYSGHDI